jgi:hypothetical protein
MSDQAANLNERIYQEEPIINGKKARPFSNSVKLKLARIFRWLDLDSDTQNEEILCAFAYLIAAPIERVSLNTLNKEAYLADKDRFLDEISADDLKLAGEWFVTVTALEKETSVEVVPKPSSSVSDKDQPPPNS